MLKIIIINLRRLRLIIISKKWRILDMKSKKLNIALLLVLSFTGTALFGADGGGRGEKRKLESGSVESDTKRVKRCDQNNFLTSFLHVAEDGQIATLEALISELKSDGDDALKAALTAVNVNGETALILASKNGHAAVVEILINAVSRSGADVVAFINTPIDQGPNQGFTPLWVASYSGHAAVVDLLLKKGADVDVANAEGVTPLCIASENGHVAVVTLLLQNGATVNAVTIQRVTSLMMASQNGHAAVVEILLQKGAVVNAATIQGITSLIIASQNGHVVVVEVLLRAQADVNVAEIEGATSLWIASENGHAAVVELLLQKGAAINAANVRGATPLWMASQQGHAAVVALLLQNGAAVNAANTDGVTPLWMASQQGHAAVVALLLQNGADVNGVVAQGPAQGWTALMIAAGKGRVEVEQLLTRWITNMPTVNRFSTEIVTLLEQADLNILNISPEYQALIIKSIGDIRELLVLLTCNDANSKNVIMQAIQDLRSYQQRITLDPINENLRKISKIRDDLITALGAYRASTSQVVVSECSICSTPADEQEGARLLPYNLCATCNTTEEAKELCGPCLDRFSADRVDDFGRRAWNCPFCNGELTRPE